MSAAACIVGAVDAALRNGSPIIGVWQSAGARLQEGRTPSTRGSVFAATVVASGRFPQVSLVVAPVAGGARTARRKLMSS